jgi:pimeloyl-ACP methyl ester carboxylesterase
VKNLKHQSATTPESIHAQRLHLILDGKRTEVAHYRLGFPQGNVLLLHEALGSVSYWKRFPHSLAQASGYNVIAYSRAGHGDSEGPLSQRSDADYLHQVQVLIPALLAHFKVTAPVLYGHSEGAGIALLYAATHPLPQKGSTESSGVRALILESPFVVATGSAGELIRKMAASYPGSKLQERLAHYHQHPDEVFYAWSNWAAGLGKEIFPLQDFLPRITCPVLALQGERDEFGTSGQLEALRRSIPHLQHQTFPNTGHLPHKEQTDFVLKTVFAFLSNLQPQGNGSKS